MFVYAYETNLALYIFILVCMFTLFHFFFMLLTIIFAVFLYLSVVAFSLPPSRINAPATFKTLRVIHFY